MKLAREINIIFLCRKSLYVFFSQLLADVGSESGACVGLKKEQKRAEKEKREGKGEPRKPEHSGDIVRRPAGKLRIFFPMRVKSI